MRWKHMQACLCIAMLVKYYHSAMPKMPNWSIILGVTKGLYLQIWYASFYDCFKLL